MNPWIDQLSSALLDMYPLPDGAIPSTTSGLPPPRVTVKPKDGTGSSIPDPLSLDKQYYTAKLQCNRRITSPDWYQDVRHIEFSFEDEIRYYPSLHPGFVEVIGSVTTQETSRSSTRKFHLRTSTLFYQRWAGQTSPIPCIPLMFHYGVSSGGLVDVIPFNGLLDQTLPNYLPPSATLRTIFTRYLNINAVPRYGFFEILHHFAGNSLEKEKLQEFITPEGAVRFYNHSDLPE